jgi:Flp pilus assembly protein protease CpaA
MIPIWFFLPLPFLLIASYQDIRQKSVTVSIIVAVFLAGLLSLAFVEGTVAGLYAHLLFGGVFLLLGMGLENVGAWKEGDTYMLGAVAFAVPPIDYIMFFAISMVALGCFAAPKALRKMKDFVGIPAITLIWILYALVM